MSIERFQGLVAEIGVQAGIPDMAVDQEGYMALSFDDHVLHLQYDSDDDVVVLFTRLPEVEDARAEQIYLMLLGANLFWQGARGGTFAVEPSTGLVFLMDRKPFAGLQVETVIAWLERFREMVGYWKERLETANRGGAIDDPDAPEGDAPDAADGIGRQGSETVIRI